MDIMDRVRAVLHEGRVLKLVSKEKVGPAVISRIGPSEYLVVLDTHHVRCNLADVLTGIVVTCTDEEIRDALAKAQ